MEGRERGGRERERVRRSKRERAKRAKQDGLIAKGREQGEKRLGGKRKLYTAEVAASKRKDREERTDGHAKIQNGYDKNAAVPRDYVASIKWRSSNSIFNAETKRMFKCKTRCRTKW